MDFVEYLMYDCYCKGMTPEDTVSRYFRFQEFQNLCADTWKQVTNQIKKKKQKSHKRRSNRGDKQ